MKTKIMIGILVCIVVTTILAFALGTDTTEIIQQLGIEFSATYAFTMILFPLTLFPLGIWAGLSAWLFGGFIAGTIIGDYKEAIVMSTISVIVYYLLILLIAGQSILMSGLTLLLPDFIAAIIITVIGGITGARMTKIKA